MRHVAPMAMILALLLIVSYSSAASPTITCALTGANVPISQAGECIETAMPLVIIGMLVSFAMVAIAFMIGNVLDISGLKNWYKGELWEATKTIIIVAMIFAVLIILGAIALGLTGNNIPVSSLPVSASGLTSAVGENLNALYSSVLTSYVDPNLALTNESYYGMEGLATGLGDLKSTSISEWIPIPIPFVGALQFGSSAHLFTSSILDSGVLPTFSFIKDLMVVVLIPVYVIFGILSVDFYSIIAASFALFIPIGIVFRAFPFLRGLGGTFIAIGIAIGLVFPALLVMFNLPIQNFIQPLIFSQSAANSYSVSTSCPHVSFNFFEDIACDGAETGYTLTALPFAAVQTVNIFDLASTKTNIDAFMAGYNSGIASIFDTSGGSIYPSFNFLTVYMYPALLQFILFIFDMVITIVIAGSIAQLLGGKLSLGVGKFKIG